VPPTSITAGANACESSVPADEQLNLASAGVDVLTMANNHAVDYGRKGLADTLSAISSAPIPVIGMLAEAGADAGAGSHAHILLCAGWLGRTYVSYGLGNLGWYTPNSVAEATSGVLTLTARDGSIVEDSWTPTSTGQAGMPASSAAQKASRRWPTGRPCASAPTSREVWMAPKRWANLLCAHRLRRCGRART
jgi:poly-gamma-glutamate capsule biosynthesis protein CapA/YwtB (metallophosphatase superfamily)